MRSAMTKTLMTTLALGLAGCANAQTKNPPADSKVEWHGAPRKAGVPKGHACEKYIQRPPLAKDAEEKRILEMLDDLYVKHRRGMMNVQPEDGRFLRVITEAVNAKHVVEIGTSNGYSGIWFCLALRKTGGKLTTFEIHKPRATLAEQNFKRAGFEKITKIVLGDAHEEVVKLKEPIDILFLDADKQGYIDYLQKLLPLVRPGGLILAHNTSNLGSAMERFLDAITSKPALETIFVHRHDQGISVSLKKR